MIVFPAPERDKNVPASSRPLKRRGFKSGLANTLRIGLVTSLCLGAASSCERIGPGSANPDLSRSVKWLQEYLRIDTSNPPGQEDAAVAFLARILEDHSIPARRLRSPKGRSSLYARLSSASPTSKPAPAMVLMHHTDVVPAGPGWSGDPFSGEIREGRIWGRGALDAKSLGIAHLAAMINLTKVRQHLNRDVIYLAVADEEQGGEQGAGWVLEQFPELFSNVSGVLNEGGGNRKLQSRLLWWGIEVAQKHPLWLEISARGNDQSVDQANRKLLSALVRLIDRKSEWRVTEPVREYLRALKGLGAVERQLDIENIDEVIAKGEQNRILMPGMRTLFLDSVQINVLETSAADDHGGAAARAQIDIRLLPDRDAGVFLEEITELLGNEVEVRVLLSSPAAPASPTDSEIYELLSGLLSPEAPVVPIFSPGFSDARYFRQAGIYCYGFSPFAIRSSEIRGIHGPNERIPLEDFKRGVERMGHIVEQWALGTHDS